jgi:hypothetical protein
MAFSAEKRIVIRVFYIEIALKDKRHHVPGGDFRSVTDQFAELVQYTLAVVDVLRARVLLAQDVHADHYSRKFNIRVHTHGQIPLVSSGGLKPQAGRGSNCH